MAFSSIPPWGMGDRLLLYYEGHTEHRKGKHSQQRSILYLRTYIRQAFITFLSTQTILVKYFLGILIYHCFDMLCSIYFVIQVITSTIVILIYRTLYLRYKFITCTSIYYMVDPCYPNSKNLELFFFLFVCFCFNFFVFCLFVFFCFFVCFFFFFFFFEAIVG